MKGVERSAKVHANAIVWDAHAGFAPFPDLDLGVLDRWVEGGASYVGINIGFDIMPWEETLRCAAHYRRWIETRPERFIVVETVQDIHRAKATGRLAVAFDIEGAIALDNNIELISMYYRIGVRHMNLAYNVNNAFGGGAHDIDIPLTALGRRAVAEMNRVGMLVDCSHSSFTTSIDICSESTQPIIFSHSNPRTMYDHGRNIRDEQMLACAATGGVVGINGISTFLNGKDARIETVFAHIDYAVGVIGIHHVGIGGDIIFKPSNNFSNNPWAWPGYTAADWAAMHTYKPEQLPEITETLLKHGYSEADVRLVMGENFLRVASLVWK